MFGALNRFISRLDSEPQKEVAPSAGPGDSTFGFQVLRNTNKELHIEPWFEFIIGINGRFLDNPDPNLLATEIQNCAGTSVSLDIWSAKGSRQYTLTVPVPHPPTTLGMTLQLAPLNSTHQIWHILQVPSSLSPAHLAGLLPHSDYILGSPSGTLRGESALGELVEDHLNRTLMLWVYNSEFDVVREVELIPRRGWGGEGALGAVLGYGALHRLPIGLGEEVQAPGEKMFEAQRTSGEYGDKIIQQDQGNYFVPAATSQQGYSQSPQLHNSNMAPPPMMSLGAEKPTGSILMPSALPTRHGKKGRHHGAASPSRGFDDMFAEGAKKSQEQDHVPSRRGTPLAPPPKAGEEASSASAPSAPQSPPSGNQATVQDVEDDGS